MFLDIRMLLLKTKLDLAWNMAKDVKNHTQHIVTTVLMWQPSLLSQIYCYCREIILPIISLQSC